MEWDPRSIYFFLPLKHVYYIQKMPLEQFVCSYFLFIYHIYLVVFVCTCMLKKTINQSIHLDYKICSVIKIITIIKYEMIITSSNITHQNISIVDHIHIEIL